ncbi:hypothetical protein GF367_02915 [Candidatus Woesearchaeota archaeon]|nr:hypothetical protein [Candidatus Woesearchaeota archaeon]
MDKKGQTFKYVLEAVVFLALLFVILHFVFGIGAYGSSLTKCEATKGTCRIVCDPGETELDHSCRQRRGGLLSGEEEQAVEKVCCFDAADVLGVSSDSVEAPEDLSTLETKAEVQPYINALTTHIWEEAAAHSGLSVDDVRQANKDDNGDPNPFTLKQDYHYPGYAEDQEELNRLTNHRDQLSS